MRSTRETIPFDPCVFHGRRPPLTRETVSTECPRCGSALTTFTLGGAEAVGCDACGYAGVEVDHSGEPRIVESWEEALERFGGESKRREE